MILPSSNDCLRSLKIPGMSHYFESIFIVFSRIFSFSLALETFANSTGTDTNCMERYQSYHSNVRDSNR